jgi:hypothetical protein
MTTTKMTTRRAGRPRTPEAFGPPKPEPHHRQEYWKRLDAILDAMEIVELDRDARLFLQRIIRTHDALRAFDPNRFTSRGEDDVVVILRVVAESSNGPAALTLPILRAVSGCMQDAWIGLRLIEAYDAIDLVGLHATLRDLGLEDQLERALRRKLEAILGRPELPSVPTKPPRPRSGRIGTATKNPAICSPAGRSELAAHLSTAHAPR